LSTPTSDAPSYREAILSTASFLTSNDRNKTYGDCLANHRAFGELLNWWYNWRGVLQPKHPSHDAAMVQVLTKIARIAVGNFKDDNYVDAAAYLAIAFECEARERDLAGLKDSIGR
jgi:hypothetical protein